MDLECWLSQPSQGAEQLISFVVGAAIPDGAVDGGCQFLGTITPPGAGAAGVADAMGISKPDGPVLSASE